ncbi:metalloprotease [Coprinopsis cinerea okayama7|uniref:Extracellular metalloproteinase n=1 Tax=Coprinopsis cinerea (strain Okayama-7 / 130 / ATCC MYA-4618 / FGSC 9003) TaxID=240176 RepID=A8NPH4_COPC7|nr:metalloprotease [Coprinopsis cinerea okayama7\|eukprot:XP_001835337.1 metalloprotease [Coprinopsis cinerea okayama7\
MLPRMQTLLSTILIAIACVAPVAQAAPSADAGFDLSTRNVYRVGKRGLEIEAFYPASEFETFGEGLELPSHLQRRAPQTLDDEAVEFVADRLKVDRGSIRYRSGYTAGKLRHAYVRQSHDGIPFANAVANVAFKDNKVVSFGTSFVKPRRFASSTPTINVQDYLPAVEEILDGKYNDHPTRLEYLARPDGTASLVYAAQIENVEDNKWYEAYIDAHNGELLSVVDFTADATYRALPITKQAYPDGLELIVDPQDSLASPSGWHASGSTLNTSGNNVISFKGSQSSLTSQSSANTFNYSYNDAQSPSVQSNVDAARVNAFYVLNVVHDFTYRYGFTEAAFNFQNDNFGKGGRGNDRVTVSVQDSSGTNNANFATPPDGQSGRCRMYIWTRTTPNRDGSLQNDILVHEVGHGITNRMTGGGSGSCLQTTESRGLGEGWSDALAMWTQQKDGVVRDYVLGDYVYNNPGGIRTRPYSTSSTTNPQTYASARGQTSVHRIGEVWANMLHNVYAALVAEHGWSATARTNPNGTEGNVVWMHLFIDSLALQPCNPTFVAARNAWIQADANRYGGRNRCLLWRVFASKGLGVNASGYTDNTAVPAGC